MTGIFEKCVVEKMISSKSDKVRFIKNIGTSGMCANYGIATVANSYASC